MLKPKNLGGAFEHPGRLIYESTKRPARESKKLKIEFTERKCACSVPLQGSEHLVNTPQRQMICHWL